MSKSSKYSTFVAQKVCRQASVVLKRLLSADITKKDGVSVKSLIFQPSIVSKKSTYALTCETLRHLPIIKDLIKAAGLHVLEDKYNAEYAYVIIYELLFGLGHIPTSGATERAVTSNKNALRAALARYLVKRKASSVEEILRQQSRASESAHPRYVRVNTLKLTMAAAKSQLSQSLPGVQVMEDGLVPNLLVMPAGTDMHAHYLVLNGSLVLQGKSSCLPAIALDPQPGWKVIDACSAPGNKTSQLAAMMEGKGQIIACELNPLRLKQMKDRLLLMGATNVDARLQDFLAMDVASAEFSTVKAILLDPSCSGSGTRAQRLDHLLPSQDSQAEEGSQERVEHLAKFQEAALRHALSFPSVERVVYSTCSVFERENEGVVQLVLPYAAQLGFELGPVLPDWPHRGHPLFVGADRLLRMDAERDGSDGFFVALFQKKALSSTDVEAEAVMDTDVEERKSAEELGCNDVPPAKSEPTPRFTSLGVLRRRKLKRQRRKEKRLQEIAQSI